MNARTFLFLLTGLVACLGVIRADDQPPTLHMPAPEAAMAPPPDAPTGPTNATVPAPGFEAQRYSDLWTKSPFAVASAEAAPDSPDYSLVGIADIDGISYASVIDKQNQNQHYLLSSDKASNGLTLVSITRGHDPADTTAVIQKNGESITLKLEVAPASTPPMTNESGASSIPMPGSMTPQIPMPGSNMTFPNGGNPNFPGGPNGGGRPPIVRFHRFPIHLPPVPSPQSQPPVQPPRPAQ